MDEWMHGDPPEPTSAVDGEEAARRANDLWQLVGQPSEEALRSLIGVRQTASGFVMDGLPVGTVEGILGGQSMPWDTMEAFIMGCLRFGGCPEDQIALELAAWRAMGNAAGTTFDVHSGGPGLGQRSEAEPTGVRRWRLPVTVASVVSVTVLVAVSWAVASGPAARLPGHPHWVADTSASGKISFPTLSIPSPPSATQDRARPRPAPTPGTTSSGDQSARPQHSTLPTGSQPQPGSGGSVPAPAPASSAPPAPTSSAPPAAPAVCTPNGCAARAYFVADGEHLFVCDNTADGYGAVTQYTRTDVPGQNNVAWNKNGASSCIDHNMNMPEGAKITFNICLGSSTGRIFDCSGYITAVA